MLIFFQEVKASVILIGILLFCINFPAFSQQLVTKKNVSGKAQRFYERGMDYARNGYYEKALRDFDTAIEHEAGFIDAHLHRASLYYESGDYKTAAKGFEQALMLDSTYVKKVWYTLALTEWKMNEYEKAAEHFQKYIQLQPRNATLLKKAERYLKNSRFAAGAVKTPVPFHPKSLGDAVNSPYPEYLPSITADGEVLVFTRRVRGQEDFYLSRKIEGEWFAGAPLQEVNTPQNEGAQCISADGKLLVFTACNRMDGYGGCDIYYSEFKRGSWTQPKNLGTPVNSRASERQPSLSADGQTLYFASNKEGGHGGFDIYFSQRDQNGSWSMPENIGDVINTPFNDETPFIHPDGQTLYFMSDGHPGMGGYDLFYSRKSGQTPWAAPKNLGYPVNTKANEGALVVSLDGTTAYFASDKDFGTENHTTSEKKHGRADTDLYSFQLHESARPHSVTYVKAVVVDAENDFPLQAMVEIADLENPELSIRIQTDEDGSFLLCLPIGKDYAMSTSKEQYVFHSENFALARENKISDPFLMKIRLIPIPEIRPDLGASDLAEGETGEAVVLKNVFFDTGSAQLRPTSFPELNRLKKLLESYPSLRIKINGHTDNIGGTAENQQLSTDRAKAVHDYLADQGISAGRLTYEGFGETKPIADNDTDKGRQLNRRTEFVVLPGGTN